MTWLEELRNAPLLMRESLAIILSTWRYRLLFVFASAASFSALFYLTTLPGQSFDSWWFSIEDSTKVFVPLASILMGLTIASQLYVWRHLKTSRVQKVKTAGGSLGAALTAVLATACCSPFFVTLLGLTGFAAMVLEYQLEFIGLALLMLLVSLYYSAKAISCDACQVKLHVHRV
ncbi:hypothetical protein KJ765_04585 [Candidatus Micrarchaeota archaeon]|nr:hypothetical protein [Candidatus Micrarchaeota archaeon]